MPYILAHIHAIIHVGIFIEKGHFAYFGMVFKFCY